MKVVTVNVPVSYIEAMAKLTGEGGLYPSRSELIRMAVKEFLLKEIRRAKYNIDTEIAPEEFDKENFVRVPHEKDDDGNVKEFKTYKILKRLD